MTEAHTLEPDLTYAIGDIHGHFEKLDQLLTKCIEHSAGRTFRIICLGDYVDRGPQSKDVVQFLMAAQDSYAGRLVCLRGNHEQMMVTAARNSAPDNITRHWLANGGQATLASYGVDEAPFIPGSHIEWLAALPLMFRSQGRLYVHAGIAPGVPLDLQRDEDLIWIREPFLSSSDKHELFVVHGHTPTQSQMPDLRENRLNLDTGVAWGGPLTAAVFVSGQINPVSFLTDSGEVSL